MAHALPQVSSRLSARRIASRTKSSCSLSSHRKMAGTAGSNPRSARACDDLGANQPVLVRDQRKQLPQSFGSAVGSDASDRGLDQLRVALSQHPGGELSGFRTAQGGEGFEGSHRDRALCPPAPWTRRRGPSRPPPIPDPDSAPSRRSCPARASPRRARGRPRHRPDWRGRRRRGDRRTRPAPTPPRCEPPDPRRREPSAAAPGPHRGPDGREPRPPPVAPRHSDPTS